MGVDNLDYQEFIDNILQARGRFACGEEYHERHHILPKCLDGADDEDNLIDLYAREHFEVHRLLALENPHNSKLQFAWWCMSSMKNKNETDRYICSPEEYEEVRKNHSKNLKGKNNPMYGVHRHGELNPMYGKKHSEETKRKIAEKAKKNVRDWTDNPYIGKSRKGKDSPSYGIKRSNECKQKLSEIRKVHRKIAQYNLNGDLLKVFNSEWEATKELGISIPLIRHSLKKLGNTAKGFIFIKIEDEISDKITLHEKTINTERKVIQYSVDGEFIALYNSVSKAAKATKSNASSIIRCCKGKQLTSGGFKWEYGE